MNLFLVYFNLDYGKQNLCGIVYLSNTFRWIFIKVCNCLLSVTISCFVIRTLHALHVMKVSNNLKRGQRGLGPMSWGQQYIVLSNQWQCFTEYKNIYVENIKNIHVHNLESLSWYCAASVGQWEAAPGHATHDSRDGADNIIIYTLDWS